jgi:hypothetical protein
MLAGYADHPTPYLGLFGIDPGPGYAEWLQGHVPTAIVEVWPEAGHYPHLPRLLTLLLTGQDDGSVMFPAHGIVALHSGDEGDSWEEIWRLPDNA